MRTFFQRPDRVAQPLHVITPIFNPIRWRSRWKLFEDFAHHCAAAGAHLHCIEAAFGNRDHALGDHDKLRGKSHFIKLRTGHELWLKENLINVAVQHLPSDWQYVAWIDADVTFARPDWADETIQQLQHYKFVQMYSRYQDLTTDFELVGGSQSFVDSYLNGPGPMPVVRKYPYHPKKGYPGVPGLAWACTREAWDSVGGLIDWAILGASDWYMAHALVGKLDSVINPAYHPRFIEMMKEWEARSERHIRRNVGVVKGLALHHWHGPKTNRRYGTRDKVLVDNQFNPDADLKRDWQGLYQLSDQHAPKSIKLRDGLRAYFRQRNEDHP